MKNQYIGGNCPKWGTWAVCKFKWGGGGRDLVKKFFSMIF